MSHNLVNKQTGELEKIAGLYNSEGLNNVLDAFPSTASSSNKLATMEDVSASESTEELIAHVETDDESASKAYEIGEQLILDGVLYTATASILIGDALVVGTNITSSDNITTQIANSGGGGGADALADLSDVALSSPASGEALAYNGTKWENTALSDVATSGASSDVSYDNTTSGLTAANVQAALDELADKKADSATTITGYGITDAYTKSEVNNMLSTIETNIDWKEAVATYADIATTYPNPQDGWTVNVKDTDYTYRYNGTAWVAISANAIPEATTSVNGLMTTTQVSKLDGIESGAEANVQADWSQATTTADDYIKNKPTLGTAAAKNSTNAVTQSDTDLVESGAVYSALANKADAPTIKTATLAANATSVTFTGMPTTGNNIISFYIDGGANYTAINTATAGEVTLTYDAESSARTVYCEIEEVS